MHSPTLPRPARTGAPSAFPAALWSGVLAGVLLVLVVVEWGPLISFDRAVAHGLHESAVRQPGLTHANRVFSDWVWDPWAMRLLIAVIVVRLWRSRERAVALWTAAVSALGAGLQQALKAVVGRDRPQWPDPVDSAHFASFPSGHAMTATVTFGLILWLLARRDKGPGTRAWLLVVALGAVSVLGVGLTRMYLGVHWASDVLGGWLLGACLVSVAAVTYERRVVSRRG
ncbi:phosphatase PAP2 family protein [Streptomyces sp. NPDC006368]|uniref:phosphatase PAP2 family protein n=1 Tax=Streptomyces sp. NPDC006368 TaxID=3156760 RepID=UPI0033B5FF8E